MLPLVLTFAEARSTRNEPGLLQTASFNQRLALEEASSMMRASSVSQSLAGFQKFTRDWVDEYKRTGMPMDSQTAAAIQLVIDYINLMYPRLVTWDGQDRKRLTDCGSNKTYYCQDFLSEEDLKKIWGEGNDTNADRQTHVECRLNQSNKITQKDVDCRDYDDYRLGDGEYKNYFSPETFPILPSCVGSEDIEVAQGQLSDNSISTTCTENGMHGCEGSENKLENMESCLENMEKWFRPLYTKFKACGHRMLPQDVSIGEQSVTNCPVDECLKHQNTFENTHCLWQTSYQDHCEAFIKCNASIPADQCTVLCDQELQINANARRAENETGERIICLLDVLLNSSNESKPGDLDSCTNKTYDTSEFIISCDGILDPPHHEPIDCNQYEEACSTDFLFKEYRNPPFMSHTPFCGCNKCGVGNKKYDFEENTTTGCSDVCKKDECWVNEGNAGCSEATHS